MTKILISLLLLSIVACGQKENKQESAINHSKGMSDWKTLEQPNYSIQYPSNWQMDQSGQMGISLFLYSPPESDSDKFRENVNLAIQDLSGQNIDINKYIEISEAQIKSMLTNSVILESKRMGNTGSEYHKLIYTGDQGVFHLKFEQYYWVVKDKAYVVTLTSEKDKFADYSDIGEKILSSFKLKN